MLIIPLYYYYSCAPLYRMLPIYRENFSDAGDRVVRHLDGLWHSGRVGTPGRAITAPGIRGD